ncbi:MAG: isoprenylcysteine carboxylmethyltransferase family protein [Candidatus Saganbacteria bacterium]|nr:isoprenylcysteine carboxylmethyltransferase family protein [Candidatus Saganbacteria bacterium]
MRVQILLTALFALNLALIWLAHARPRELGWYRSVAGVFAVLIPLASVFFPQPRFELDYFWWRIAGGLFIAGGFSLIGWAASALTGGWPRPGLAPERLITGGPYALVRHPVYLGLIFVLAGWWWLWAAVYSFYFGMVCLALIWAEAYLEEKLLLEPKFGADFRAYRQRTGMFWIK